MGPEPAGDRRRRRLRRLRHLPPTSTDRDLAYVVAVKGATLAHPTDAVPAAAPYSGRGRPPTRRYPAAVTCKDLVLAAGTAALTELTWRRGTKTGPGNPNAAWGCGSRFVALRVRPANRTIPRGEDGVLPQAWLLAEWPTEASEPTDFWLATLPQDTPIAELVRLAKIRWRIEHDYRELKTGLGPIISRADPGWAGTTTRHSSPPRTCSSPLCGSPTQKRPGRPEPSTPSCANSNAHWPIGSVPARPATIPSQPNKALLGPAMSNPQSLFTQLTQKAEDGRLFLEPDAAATCAKACADFLIVLDELRSRTNRLLCRDAFGPPSARALGQKFDNKAIGPGGFGRRPPATHRHRHPHEVLQWC